MLEKDVLWVDVRSVSVYVVCRVDPRDKASDGEHEVIEDGYWPVICDLNYKSNDYCKKIWTHCFVLFYRFQTDHNWRSYYVAECQMAEVLSAMIVISLLSCLYYHIYRLPIFLIFCLYHTLFTENMFSVRLSITTCVWCRLSTAKSVFCRSACRAGLVHLFCLSLSAERPAFVLSFVFLFCIAQWSYLGSASWDSPVNGSTSPTKRR